jgi:8-oxo-dGTP pyrophosphatase MutT (NUDIX family)
MAKNKPARFNPKKEVSVMAWIEDDKGSVLLVQQVVGQRLWTLPGGKVKRNEPLKRALKREVREETGLDINAIGYQQMYDRPKRGELLFCSRSRSKDTLLECIFLWQKSPILGSLTVFLRMRLRRQSFSGSRSALIDFTGMSA